MRSPGRLVPAAAVEQVAWALLADANRFARSQVVAPRLAPTGERDAVPADPFDWEGHRA